MYTSYMCMGLSYVTHNKNGNYYLLETYFSLKWHEPRKYLWSLGTAFALGIPIIHSHNDINMGSRAKLVVIKMTKIMTSLCRKDFSLHISKLKKDPRAISCKFVQFKLDYTSLKLVLVVSARALFHI